MSYYVRRVKRTVWPEENTDLKVALDNFDDMLADPLTDCTRTSNGTLSLWSINEKEDDKNAIIALITAPDQKTISGMEIIYITENHLEEYSLNVNKTNGRTSVNELVPTHYDIVGVNYKKLQDVGKLILSILMTEGSKKIGRSDVIEILKCYLFSDIKENYVKINDTLLILMGEDTQIELLKTDFYKQLTPKFFLDLKISVINLLFKTDLSLILSKISNMNIKEKMALKGGLKMQSETPVNKKLEIHEELKKFIEA